MMATRKTTGRATERNAQQQSCADHKKKLLQIKQDLDHEREENRNLREQLRESQKFSESHIDTITDIRSKLELASQDIGALESKLAHEHEQGAKAQQCVQEQKLMIQTLEHNVCAAREIIEDISAQFANERTDFASQLAELQNKMDTDEKLLSNKAWLQENLADSFRRIIVEGLQSRR